nr:3-oxoacyl-[acyl-carrier-protein] reductase, chloroplastic-like [Ipomoea batatas]
MTILPSIVDPTHAKQNGEPSESGAPPGAVAGPYRQGGDGDRLTGASSGIGREISLDLAKAGCRVITAARRVDRLKSLCDEINGAGSGEPSSGAPLRAVAIELDVTADGPAIEAAVQRAWKAFGRIDVMALELGANKIRVNSISLGLFKSEITQGLMQKDWLNNVALRTVPLRTFGTSNPALTALVRYLIHDSSEYISGNNYIVDAGTSLPGVPIFSSLCNNSWILVKRFR